jgi:hypothetical protein
VLVLRKSIIRIARGPCAASVGSTKVNSLPRGGENAQVPMLTAALITSALVGEGTSQTSAVTQLQKQGTRVITFRARAGPVPGVHVPGVHLPESSTHLRDELLAFD